MTITQCEENALRYAAGYVARKVTENIEHSKCPLPLKLKLLSGLEMLCDENSSEHPHDSSAWIDMIDRGGLWHVKDIVYPVFYAMEEEMRRQVHQLSPQHPTLDVKNLQDLLTKNEDVLFYWAMASMEFHNEDDTSHRTFDASFICPIIALALASGVGKRSNYDITTGTNCPTSS